MINTTLLDIVTYLETQTQESHGRLFGQIVIDIRYNGNSVTVKLQDAEKPGDYLSFEGEEYAVIEAVGKYFNKD